MTRLPSPPRWADALLRLSLSPRDRDTVTGDLIEEYREVILPMRGPVRARVWYFRQALSLVPGLRLGVILGAAFGIWNLLATMRDPLADDTAGALVIFYGPMFMAWGIASFAATRRSGRFADAVKTGSIAGFVTIAVFWIANLARVNLFLGSVQHRIDWQQLMVRFHDSGFDSLRAFVNYEYVSGLWLMIAVGVLIGAAVGVLAGAAASAWGADGGGGGNRTRSHRNGETETEMS